MGDEHLSQREGVVCIVTGANSGIGKEITRKLASHGARVVMACRSMERGRTARRELTESTGNDQLELMQVDLSLQSSIRSFSDRFQKRFDRLDVLVNNAGILPFRREETEEGIETTWATNVLGYFVTSNQFEPMLVDSAPSRIVDVASRFAGGLKLDDLEFERRIFSGWRAYAQSKQANRMLAWVRAEHLRDRKVTVNVAHPGGVSSNLFRNQVWPLRWAAHGFGKLFGNSPEQGADTPAWLAMDPELDNVTGGFWQDRTRLPRKYDREQRNRALWERCESMIRSDGASTTA